MYTKEQIERAGLSEEQIELLQEFGWGVAGVEPGKEPGTWVVYNTTQKTTFHFDPRDVFGPYVAYTV